MAVVTNGLTATTKIISLFQILKINTSILNIKFWFRKFGWIFNRRPISRIQFNKKNKTVACKHIYIYLLCQNF